MRMKYFCLNLIVLILFVADRALKFYFIHNPAKIIGGDFIFNLLSFRLAKNQGIAFGILFNQIALIIFIILVIFILVWFLVKAYGQKNYWEIFGLTAIVIGAISNLLDRLRFGYVIDYIDVPFFTVFNLADCLITVGVLILFLVIFKNKRVL